MWTVSPQGWSPQENRQWRYIHPTHIHAPVVGFWCIHVVYGVHFTGKFKRHEHSERVILGVCCTLLPSTTLASLCFMTVCMFMRGRARMHIVHGLWRVSSLGSLGGQAGGDCKYCVCVRVCTRRGTAVGLCPGLRGGIRTTLTHTPFYYFPFILTFPWPLSSHHFPPVFLSKSTFPQPSVSLLPSVPLHLLICVALSLLFQVGQQ